MGDERGLAMRPWLALTLCGVLLGASTAGCGGCGSDQEERKRALLTPRTSKAAIAARRQEQRLFGDDGELLESDQKVAGVTLPKGLTPERAMDNHWFFRAEHIPAAALVRYFQKRLNSMTLERSEGAVVFGGAVPKDNPAALRLRVQIVQLRGSDHKSQLYIRQSVPYQPLPASEAAARIEAQRKYAD
jgi:hypothetical protein